MLRLSVENDQVVLSVGEEQKSIQSSDHLYKLLAEICREQDIKPEDLIVMSSSSFNWPEEYTDCPETIQLCHELEQASFKSTT